MEKITLKDSLKFLLISSIGIFLYFIPISGTTVPVVYLVNLIRSSFSVEIQKIILVLIVSSYALVTILGKLKFQKFQKFSNGIGPIKFFLIVMGFLISIFELFDLPPASIFANDSISGTILTLSFSIFLTVAICGAFVVFILKSGIVEFTGTLFEPLMRPVYKLPGAAAVNMITSFIVSAAVGVFMSDKYYEDKIYTKREAVSSAISFSTISIGFIGVLCSMGGVSELYGLCLMLTFALVLILTPLFVRIPPLSRVSDLYIDGETIEKKSLNNDNQPLLKKAWRRGCLKSREFTLDSIKTSFISALKFGQSIATGQIPVVILTLTIVTYTPLFEYLGYPFIPILKILGLPNAVEISPSILLGFISITLPVLSIAGKAIETQSIFFIIMLSISQLIFVTEPVNAMINSKMGITFKDALLNFIVKTIISIPVIAILSHILF